MHNYEIMYIIDNDCADKDAIKTKLHQVLTANGGKITSTDEWGEREFAYPINGKNKGYYMLLKLTTSNEQLTEFKRLANINQNVVRYLIVNLDTEKNYTVKKRPPKAKHFEKKGYNNRRGGSDHPRRNRRPHEAESSEKRLKPAPKPEASATEAKKTEKPAKPTTDSNSNKESKPNSNA